MYIIKKAGKNIYNIRRETKNIYTTLIYNKGIGRAVMQNVQPWGGVD